MPICGGLHSDRLTCPNGHPLPSDQAPHTRESVPVVNNRCRECGAVFNIFTDTVCQKTAYGIWTIVLLLRSFARGCPRSSSPMNSVCTTSRC